jgi:hypothetical protein
MDLNSTDIGHFIDQLSQACIYFGFSTEDATTLATNLNSQYNVACAPPITINQSQGPELLSLCQDTTTPGACPLAEPSPDCAAYLNLQPGGLGNSSSSSSSDSSTPTPSSSTSSTAAATTSPPPAISAAGPPGKSGKLGGGAIAGIVIGSIAVLLFAIGLGLFFFRRNRSNGEAPQSTNQSHSQFTPNSAYASPAFTDQHTSYISSAPPGHTPWQGPMTAELESPRQGLPEMAEPYHPDSRFST